MRKSYIGGIYEWDDTNEDELERNDTNEQGVSKLRTRIFWPWAEWIQSSLVPCQGKPRSGRAGDLVVTRLNPGDFS